MTCRLFGSLFGIVHATTDNIANAALKLEFRSMRRAGTADAFKFWNLSKIKSFEIIYTIQTKIQLTDLKISLDTNIPHFRDFIRRRDGHLWVVKINPTLAIIPQEL